MPAKKLNSKTLSWILFGVLTASICLSMLLGQSNLLNQERQRSATFDHARCKQLVINLSPRLFPWESSGDPSVDHLLFDQYAAQLQQRSGMMSAWLWSGKNPYSDAYIDYLINDYKRSLDFVAEAHCTVDKISSIQWVMFEATEQKLGQYCRAHY
jgi:hypothetical protein